MRSTLYGIALTLLALGLSPLSAAEFSAKMIQETPAGEVAGRINVKDAKYRMTTQEEGRPLIIIVDGAARVTRILSAELKMYAEVPIDHPVSLHNDPFQVVRQEIPGATWKSEGNETIAEHVCEKRVLRSEDGAAIMSQWVSRELGFPLKIVAGPRTVELSRIRVGSLPDRLFIIPDGFEKLAIDEMGAALAAAARKEPAVPAAAKPRSLRKMLGGESRWRLRLGPESEVELEVEPFGEGARWFAQPFRAGKPLRELAACRHEGKQKLSFGKELRADELRIGVVEGDASLLANIHGRDALLSSTLQYTIAHGSKGVSVRHPYELVRVTLTGVTEKDRTSAGALRVGRATATGGVEEEKIEVTLQGGEVKVWEFAKNEKIQRLGVNFWRGRVEVKIEEVYSPALVSAGAGGSRKKTDVAGRAPAAKGP